MEENNTNNVYDVTDQNKHIYENEQNETKKSDKPWNIFAKFGFIFGIIGISTFAIPFVNYMVLVSLTTIFGVVMSALGLKSKTRHGKAKVGLIFSIISLVCGFVLVVVYSTLIFVTRK